jgi:hypothetical protein
MSSPKDFHDFALKCMRLARKASNDKEREVFLAMSAYWMRAAVQLERSITFPDDEPDVPGRDGT